MTQVVKSKDGNWYADRSGEWVQVSENEARALQSGALESFGRSAAYGAGELLAGWGQLMGDPRAKPERERLAEAARPYREANPVAAFAGQMAPYAAGALMPGGLPTALLTEGVLGAATFPENPVAGAAFGAGSLGAATVGLRGAQAMNRAVNRTFSPGTERGLRVANDVITLSEARAQQRAQQARSLSAARSNDPNFARTERELRGFATPEQLEELGFRLTPAERAALNATSREALDQANKLRDLEDLASSTNVSLTPLKLTDIPGLDRFARDDKRAAFTSFLGDILDEPNVDTLTRVRLGDILDDTQAVFKDYIDRNPNPVPLRDVKETVDQLAEAAGVNSQRQMESLAKRIEDATEGRDFFNPGEFSSLSTRVNRDMKNAFNAGNYELGTALSQVKDALDDALERVIQRTNPEAMSELTNARRKYGIIKALQAGRAVDPSGTVNPATFQRNFARTNRRYATGKRDDEFSQILDAVVYLTSRQTGDSGTAARLAVRGVGAAPAGLLGYGFLSQ